MKIDKVFIDMIKKNYTPPKDIGEPTKLENPIVIVALSVFLMILVLLFL